MSELPNEIPVVWWWATSQRDTVWYDDHVPRKPGREQELLQSPQIPGAPPFYKGEITCEAAMTGRNTNWEDKLLYLLRLYVILAVMHNVSGFIYRGCLAFLIFTICNTPTLYNPLSINNGTTPELRIQGSLIFERSSKNDTEPTPSSLICMSTSSEING